MPSQNDLEQLQPPSAPAAAMSDALTDATRTVQALESTAAKMAELRATDMAVSSFTSVDNTIDIGHAPAVLPPWLIDADAEERRELEELGVVVAPTFDADAERDALISRLMRAQHEHNADVERYDAAEAIERQTITARYDRLRAPAIRQAMRLGSFIAHLVSTVTFTGKKKSRSVGWGSYGQRKQPDKVEITDAPAMIAAVKAIRPEVVTVMVTTNARVHQAVEALLDSAITSGQLQLTGTDVSVLSELRAQLRSGLASVSKPAVGALLKEEKDGQPVHAIPGVSVIIGTDKPWYEVEPPTNG